MTEVQAKGHRSPQVIGVDLGGTAIKLGRFDVGGRCLQSVTVPTPQPPEPEAVLGAIARALPLVDPDDCAIALGLGTPGPVDETGRIALVAINLGWQNVPLADWLERHTGKPVIAANDANCAGLGEAWLGAGRRFQDLLLLTLGTGVGGAVILGGQLFVGRHGTGAELGLMTLDPSGETCNSGNHGSLEQLVSVQAIRRKTGLEPAELGQRAVAGDAEAIAFWQTYGRDLGAGIANLVYIFTPEAVILGGGISASAPLFMPTLWEEVKRRVLPTSREGLQILTAELGNQAGIVGAARLAWQHIQALQSADPHPSPKAPTDLHVAYYLATQNAQFKAGFLGRTAHELRSPLNGVIGMHQLILGDLCDDVAEERDFLEQAHQSALKMVNLLDEVIRISKVDTGTLPLQLQPVQAAELLKTVYEMIHLQAQDRNIRLEFSFPDPAIYVEADPDVLCQVLTHRIDSLILTPDISRIRVGADLGVGDEAQPGLCFWVEDGRPAAAWQESRDSMEGDRTPLPPFPSKAHLPTFQTPPHLSPGLLLQIDQILLERMGSRLEWAAADPDAIRLQWTLPLANI